MKKYVGTKMLEAKPMNRGEYNRYRGWPIPQDENPDDEGYLVKYHDGYESWSPKEVFEESYSEYDETKLPFTALGLQSKDYKERFKAEYLQLKIRMNGLSVMLEKYKNGTLNFTPSCSYDLLNGQFKAMDLYASYLEDRASVEDINLE